MDDPNQRRCPHYQLYSEPLEMEGPAACLAIRHCLLTERVIRLLQSSPDGKRLADKLVIHVANNRAYAFIGPDLEAVTQSTCTLQHCEGRCTPAYTQQLVHFNVEDARFDEVTCSEEDALPEEIEKARATAPHGSTSNSCAPASL